MNQLYKHNDGKIYHWLVRGFSSNNCDGFSCLEYSNLSCSFLMEDKGEICTASSVSLLLWHDQKYLELVSFHYFIAVKLCSKGIVMDLASVASFKVN